ncbi:hypothetical protein [Mucilaginibacter pedocola]|nr:hypothetical protein [Mucilaginibacter pedocola]
MQSILKVLDPSDMRILKHIYIIADGKHGDYHLASLIYLRKASENYKIIEGQQEEISDFENLFNEHPKQENYPVDVVDSLVINAVKNAYPKSIVKGDIVVFNSDVEKIQILKNRRIKQVYLNITPNIADLYNDLPKLRSMSFSGLDIPLNIYTDYNPNKISHLRFFAKYKLDDVTAIEDFKEVEFV